MDALLTVSTTAGVSGDQCLRLADLLGRMAARLYDYIGDSDDPLLQEAERDAQEWTRLGTLCKRKESQEQVTI